MNYRTHSEIKAAARGRLIGRYTVAAGAFVSVELITFLVTRFLSGMVDRTDMMGYVLYIAILIISGIILSLLMVGELSIYMKLSSGQEAKITDIFSVFTTHADKALAVEIIMSLMKLACFVPSIILMISYYYMQDSDILWWAFWIAFVLGALGATYVAVKYSQCFYVLLDFPEYTVKQVIRRATKIIQGQMWKYVKLVISFIPLGILGFMSFGIGMIFVYPYFKMTLTEFYLDIIRN